MFIRIEASLCVAILGAPRSSLRLVSPSVTSSVASYIFRSYYSVLWHILANILGSYLPCLNTLNRLHKGHLLQRIPVPKYIITVIIAGITVNVLR